MTYFESVLEFHQKFGQPILTSPTIPDEKRKALRKSLIAEESAELFKAIDEGDLVGIADGLCDLHYVICGTALEFGIPEPECFAEVHRSNMSKLWPDGKPHYREDGKVLKPDTYSPADLKRILESEL